MKKILATAKELRSATSSPVKAAAPERRGSDIPKGPCVTRFECAELLHVSVRTVDRMIAAGEIRVRRVRGKVVRFLRSDVDKYLSEEKEKGRKAEG